MIRTAREVNDYKPHYVIEKVKEAVRGIGVKPVVACFGLAFKPDVDDLRESPAVAITLDLAKGGGLEVLAVEPHVRELPKKLQDVGVSLVDVESAIARADVLVLLVDHKVFKEIPVTSLAGKRIVDTRGIWR